MVQYLALPCTLRDDVTMLWSTKRINFTMTHALYLSGRGRIFIGLHSQGRGRISSLIVPLNVPSTEFRQTPDSASRTLHVLVWLPSPHLTEVITRSFQTLAKMVQLPQVTHLSGPRLPMRRATMRTAAAILEPQYKDIVFGCERGLQFTPRAPHAMM